MASGRARKERTLDDALRNAGISTVAVPAVPAAVQDPSALGPMAPDEQEIERRETALKLDKLIAAVDDISEERDGPSGARRARVAKWAHRHLT